MPQNRMRALIVDDSATIRNIIHRMLWQHLQIEVVDTTVDGLGAFEVRPYQSVIRH